MTNTPSPHARNFILLMHGETDKNCIITSCAQFFDEFGECDGLIEATDALHHTEGSLYVVQAKVFDDKKLEEVAEFGKRAIDEIHCVLGQETIDIQRWMIKLAEKMNTLAYLIPEAQPVSSPIEYRAGLTNIDEN